ncbi:hypothetical protein D3C83_67640 [compost metagenome]
MPGVFFAATIFASVSSIALATRGAFGSPGWPIDCERSEGPMKKTSTPSTFRISSTFGNAASSSICTHTSVRRLASSTKPPIEPLKP